MEEGVVNFPSSFLTCSFSSCSRSLRVPVRLAPSLLPLLGAALLRHRLLLVRLLGHLQQGVWGQGSSCNAMAGPSQQYMPTWQWELTPFLHHHHYTTTLFCWLWCWPWRLPYYCSTTNTTLCLFCHEDQVCLFVILSHTMLNANFNLQSWKLKFEYQNIQIEDWKNAKIRNRPLAPIQHLGIYDQIKRFLVWSSINAQVLVLCQGSIQFFLHFCILQYVYFEILKEFVVDI